MYGRGPSVGGMAAFEIIAIIVAMVGGAIAYEEIDNWSQWLVLGVIIVTADRRDDRPQPEPPRRLSTPRLCERTHRSARPRVAYGCADAH